MKKILVFFLVLVVTMNVCLAAFATDENTRMLNPVPCMVNGIDVNERVKPNGEIVREHAYRDVVYVMDMGGDWWRLTNGNYMHSNYLTPISEDMIDELGNVGYFDGLDSYYEQIGGWYEQVDMTQPRMLALVYASASTSKLDLIAIYDSFVLFSVSEEHLEFYRGGEMVALVELKASPLKFTTKVTDYYGEYNVYSVLKIMEILYRYSSNYEYFVVRP